MSVFDDGPVKGNDSEAETPTNSASSDGTIREVVENARSLSPLDERVQVVERVHEAFEPSAAWLSSFLFAADVTRACEMAGDALGPGLQGEVYVTLEQSSTFEGYGDGYVRATITADAETQEIQAVNITQVLSAETQRALAD